MDPSCNWECYKKLRTNNTPLTPRKITELKIVFLDMDGVLADINGSWRQIHQYFHKNNNTNVQNYLKGELTDQEFIQSDINQWRQPNGTLPSKKDIQNIYSNAPLMRGAVQFIKYLKKHRILTAIISAGVDILAHQIQQILGIDLCYANTLNIDKDNILTGAGTVNVPLIHKDQAIKKILKNHNIQAHQAIAIGNSCFDIPMFYAVGIGIAFNPSDTCITKEADHIIPTKNLADLIPLIDTYLQNNQP